MQLLPAGQSIWFLKEVLADLGFTDGEISEYCGHASHAPKNRLVSAHINSALGLQHDWEIVTEHLDRMVKLFGYHGLRDDVGGRSVLLCPGCNPFDDSHSGITVVFLNVTATASSDSILTKAQQKKGLLLGLEVALMLIGQPFLCRELCRHDSNNILSFVAPGLISARSGLPIEIYGCKDYLCASSFCRTQKASVVTCEGIG